MLTRSGETGKVLVSTISENAEMMGELLGLQRRKFQPSIPHLVYQYDFYSNYESEGLARENPEVA